MNKKIIIENTQQQLSASIIIDELASIFSKDKRLTKIDVKKSNLKNTKGDINVFLQLAFEMGISLAASGIYDLIKIIIVSKYSSLKNSSNNQAITLTVQTDTEKHNICISLGTSSNDINIDIR